MFNAELLMLNLVSQTCGVRYVYTKGREGTRSARSGNGDRNQNCGQLLWL